MLRLFVSMAVATEIFSMTAPATAIENTKCYNKCQLKKQGQPKKIPKCIYKCEMKRSNRWARCFVPSGKVSSIDHLARLRSGGARCSIQYAGENRRSLRSLEQRAPKEFRRGAKLIGRAIRCFIRSRTQAPARCLPSTSGKPACSGRDLFSRRLREIRRQGRSELGGIRPAGFGCERLGRQLPVVPRRVRRGCGRIGARRHALDRHKRSRFQG